MAEKLKAKPRNALLRAAVAPSYALHSQSLA